MLNKEKVVKSWNNDLLRILMKTKKPPKKNRQKFGYQKQAIESFLKGDKKMFLHFLLEAATAFDPAEILSEKNKQQVKRQEQTLSIINQNYLDLWWNLLGEKLRPHKIPCTKGYGVGLCDGLMAGFTSNLIISLDHNSTMPTEKELAMLASYQEFLIRLRLHITNPEKILQMEFPSDQGYNTVIFIKGDHLWDANGKNGWAYRRMTWEIDPLFSPGLNPDNTKPQLTLVQLLDKIENKIPEKWKKWKEEHPDIFKSKSAA